MAMADTPYSPIDCSLHDRLESLATLGQECRITYQGSAGVDRELTERIADVFSRGGEEFLKTASGILIRLDRLRSVDGIPFDPGGECPLPGAAAGQR